LDKRAKLIAALGVAFEHVERRCARGKKDHFTGLRDGMRAFDRIGERVRNFRFDRTAPAAPDILGHFAD
jgi:hypothetical protein